MTGSGEKAFVVRAEYFNRMKSMGLYTTDIAEIKSRVDKVNLANILAEKLL